ncbi:MAG TPA: LD-carboxypeptidase [Fimbriimonas sp.]
MRFCQPGDTVAIVAPAGPVKTDLRHASSWLEGEGYRVRTLPHVAGRWRYLAGTDEERAQDLHEAFFDPDVAAVLCARGGYGCSRLLPLLDLDRMAATHKPFLGFSDVTMLHLALNRRGLATFHAPMGGHIGQWTDGWPAECYRRTLRGDFSYPATMPAGETLVPGRARGVVTGGCLSLLGDSLGTPDAFDGRGRIVILEDVNEAPYRVDARLTHLLNSGVLDGALGFVVGEFTGTDAKIEEGCEDCSWKDIVRERLEPLGAPLIWNYPFGHIQNARALPLGVEAVLDADAGTLSYL